MKKELAEKIAALMQNETFRKEFDRCRSTEELSALLAANGIALSAGEIERFTLGLTDGENGELDEQALEAVAGGGKIWNRIKRSWNNYWGGFNPFGSPASAWNAGKKAAENQHNGNY